MLRNFGYKRHIIILGAFVLLLGIMVPLASFAKSSSVGSPSKKSAPEGYSFFADAKIVTPGDASRHAVKLDSNVNDKVLYGGINFKVPAGTTFANIQTLSTDYDFTHNSCGGGSPRFQINVVIAGVTKSAFVYIGPPPNYTGCAMNTWVSTGNLVAPASFVDTSQLPGGTFYDTFASADAKYGSDAVTGIQVVADGEWFFTSGQQTVLVDNVVINNKTYGFEHAND